MQEEHKVLKEGTLNADLPWWLGFLELHSKQQAGNTQELEVVFLEEWSITQEFVHNGNTEEKRLHLQIEFSNELQAHRDLLVYLNRALAQLCTALQTAL